MTLVCRVGAPVFSESRFLWRVSPGGRDALISSAQMNLDLDILRIPFGDVM